MNRKYKFPTYKRFVKLENDNVILHEDYMTAKENKPLKRELPNRGSGGWCKVHDDMVGHTVSEFSSLYFVRKINHV
jgi:hypothetical protein